MERLTVYMVGFLLTGVSVLAKPTAPSWLWEPVAPSEGTCGHFHGNISHAGYVYTPKYPSNYPDSLTCEATIYIPEDHMARLYFVDFALEASRDCWLDRLEVYELDPLERRHFLGSFCGRDKPPLIVSAGQALHLIFTSDRYVSSRGFRAKLEFIPLF